jgi:succinate dehydrogenase / fumarate reductase iron-sulfur subunit
VIDPPRFQSYSVPVTEPMTVLDCLTHIQLTQDRSLMFRHSCHHSSCGTCAMRINQTERLACITPVWSLNTSVITLAPLHGFDRIGDLVVDMESFYRDIDENWRHLRPVEIPAGASAQNPPGWMRFENCIECGCCVSACPVPGGSDAFMGPAALAAIHHEIIKSPDKKTSLLKRADGDRGQRQCRRALACSRVCPTTVYPARHIADIRKYLQDISDTPFSRDSDK